MVSSTSGRAAEPAKAEANGGSDETPAGSPLATEVDTATGNGVGAAETAEPAGKERGYHLEIFLISFAALLLEISYTRIVSFKLFYYYTYLVIGLALLGIGTGGVLIVDLRSAASAPRPTRS